MKLLAGDAGACCRESERERERDRDRDTESERGREGERERETERKRVREREKKREKREREREREREKERKSWLLFAGGSSSWIRGDCRSLGRTLFARLELSGVTGSDFYHTSIISFLNRRLL